jgi:hypothetical protein
VEEEKRVSFEDEANLVRANTAVKKKRDLAGSASRYIERGKTKGKEKKVFL